MIAAPARGDQLNCPHDRIAVHAEPQFQRETRPDAPAVLTEERDLRARRRSWDVGAPNTVRSASDPSSRRTSTGRDIARTLESRPLHVRAGLDDVLAAPVANEADRLDPLDAANVPFLTVEIASTLGLWREGHRRLAVGFDLDLKSAARHRRLEDDIRRNREPVEEPGGPAFLIEVGRDLGRPEGAHRGTTRSPAER